MELGVCAVWSESLFVAHSTLLEISCRSSIDIYFVYASREGTGGCTVALPEHSLLDNATCAKISCDAVADPERVLGVQAIPPPCPLF